MNYKLLSGLIIALGFTACKAPSSSEKGNDPLFRLIPVSQSNVGFNNRIVENDTLNILDFEYVYNGGGVGIGDFNADGKPDLVFAGNQVDNALYLNKGNFQFEEVGALAGVDASGRWCTGVAVADVNGDGKDDIYLANSVHKPGAARANLLYLNQGNDENGIPTFLEAAEAYGIADTGHSTHAAFLDYDRDGDLDLYVLTNEMEKKRTPNRYRYKKTKGENPNTDQLYRNNGDGIFSNVSQQAGISIEGYGLGVGIADLNRDGWPDIYVTNDYLTNDLVYINQKDGTFKDEASAYLRHTSYSAMGHDIADINNDGLVDVMAVDMLPATQERKKQMIGESRYLAYRNNDKFGYDHQYVRNTMQVNQGKSADAPSTFADVSEMTGLEETDWSWSPLLVDVDLDGDRDLLISNGFPKDVTDHDFGFYRVSKEAILDSKEKLQGLIPEVKIPNYGFENKGKLQFENTTRSWGLHRPSFSHGAAYVDLDGDGDLDYVTNNMGDSAFVYQNMATELDSSASSLTLQLKGSALNPKAIGAQVWLYTADGLQYAEQSPYRGYMSTVSTDLVFGLGGQMQADSILIRWPDGQISRFAELPAGMHTLGMEQAKPGSLPPEDVKPVMEAMAGIPSYVHEEADKIDFNIQRTLPHKYTQGGPGMAVGDVDGSGSQDLVIGGSAGKGMRLFSGQAPNGNLKPVESSSLTQADPGEDMGVLLFDADGDEDLDLYRVRGSYEFQVGADELQDELWLNDGKGNFTRDMAALPEMKVSGSCVRAADMDGDGDLDLFVGGQVVTSAYPMPAESFLLRNEGGRFVDVSEEWFPDGKKIGLIQDALWTDVDLDGQFDLLLAGRWMAPTWYRNTGNGFEDMTQSSGLAAYSGWWNSLTGADFDRDGDIDYIAGNWGLNSSYCAAPDEPMQIYADDFDGNGSTDAVIGCYFDQADGGRGAYAIHTRLDIIKQLNLMRGRYPTFASYGAQPFGDLLTEDEKKKAYYAQATHLGTSYLENKGDGTFEVHELPRAMQLAPVYGLVSTDVNQDGYLDVLAVGNDFGVEVLSGRHDAFSGLVLLGDGKGNFKELSIGESGFFVPGDAKGLVSISNKVLASQNRGPLLGFEGAADSAPAEQVPTEVAAYSIQYSDGRVGRAEAYIGSGYLSQSARLFSVPAKARVGEKIGW